MAQYLNQQGHLIVLFRVLGGQLCVHTLPITDYSLQNTPNYRCIVAAAKKACDSLDWDDEFVYMVDCNLHTCKVVKYATRNGQEYLGPRVPNPARYRDYTLELFDRVILKHLDWLD